MAKKLFQVGDLVVHSDDSECGIVLDASQRRHIVGWWRGRRNSVKVLFGDGEIDWIQTKYLTNVCKNTENLV